MVQIANIFFTKIVCHIRLLPTHNVIYTHFTNIKQEMASNSA